MRFLSALRPRSERSAVALVAAALGAVALLAYGNSFGVPLLLDDQSAIAHNPSIRRFWSLAPLQPPADIGTGGRPLTNLSFAFNYALGGTRVAGYHVFNLTIHVLTGLLLFGALRRTLSAGASPGFNLSRRPEEALLLAAGVAALWLVHPVHPASVTYLSQRSELLMAFCYLATLYAFIRGSRPSAARIWLPLSVLACWLGTAAKEVMVTAPVAVLLYDRTFVSGTFRAAVLRRRSYYLFLAASWLLLARLLQTDLAAREVGVGLGVSVWHYMLTESKAVILYLCRAAWPSPLVFDYGPEFIRTLVGALPFLVPLTALVGGALWLVGRNRAAGFLAFGFFLLLAPTSSVIPVALQPIAENRAYLPIATFIPFALLGAYRAIGARVFAPVAVAVLAGIGLTFARNAIFADPLALTADTLAKRPTNPRAYESHVGVLRSLGRSAEAVPFARRAIELSPRSAVSHALLGECLMDLGQTDDALARFARALELNPKSGSALGNRGNIFYRANRLTEAVAEFEALLRIEPASAAAHRNLALSFDRLGRPAEAEHHFRATLQLSPEDSYSHFDYAAFLTRRPDWPAALPHFREAVRLQPNWPEAVYGLAVTLYNLSDYRGAAGQLERVLQLKPDFPPVRRALDEVRAKLAAEK